MKLLVWSLLIVLFAGILQVSIAGKRNKICGGIAGVQCRKGQYCKYDAGVCGTGDQTGKCVRVPTICAAIYSPVCGCDGQNYGNNCEAASAGVSVDFADRCEEKKFPGSSFEPCGGFVIEGPRECTNPEEFCYRTESAMCGRADAGGVCALKPQVCTRIYGPVCGCTGTTHSNECVAWSNGDSVDYVGECN